MKVTGGVTQITAGCGLCTTLAGAFAGVPMIILGANMAIEGIQDLWHVVKGDLDVQSKNLLKEATGHKVDNILDLAELVSTVGSAKAASKTSSKAFTEASSKLRRELNKARKVETVVSEEARLTSRAARQFIRRECGAFRGPKRFAKPVDFSRLFKKHGVKTTPGPGLQPLSEAELEKIVGGAKDPSWRPGGAASAGETKTPGPKSDSQIVVKEVSRKEAFRAAKESAGIPKSSQYDVHKYVYDGSTENRTVYEYTVDGQKRYIVEHREDLMGRGPHFHSADSEKGSPFEKGRYNQYDGHFPESFDGYKK